MTAPAFRVLVLSPLLLAAAKSVPDPAQTLSGKYYRQFPNAFVSGEKYTGEDIVEIVPVRAGAAYLRIDLSYSNGHSCQIYGVARSEGDTLTYRDLSPTYDGRPCVVTVKRSGKTLLIDDDEGTCQGHCGARGSLAGVSLPYSSKRPIRYMQRLKYKWALDEWRTGTPIADQWKKEYPPASPPSSCTPNCEM